MKLGIIGAPNEEGFIQASSKGLDFLEFCINAPKENDKPIYDNIKEFCANIPSIKNWINQYGVKVQSIGRWGSDRIDANGRIIVEELEQTYKLIDSASELECPNFVCGCNYVEDLSYYSNCTSAIEYFSKIIDYGKKKGINISTYNCRWNNFVNDPMSWTVIHGHLKELGIKYDPSHSRYAGGDYIREMKDWGDRFNHVHIKGSLIINGERFDDPPAGLDQTDWGTFMAILYAKKYEGGLSIEPHSANWKNELGDKGVNFTIEYMRKLVL